MLRHFCRRANGRALVGRWSVTRRDAPLDHPPASPAHNDKRHSILPEMRGRIRGQDHADLFGFA